eukprot:2196588-Prorocentrum_lima.AAC.1
MSVLEAGAEAPGRGMERKNVDQFLVWPSLQHLRGPETAGHDGTKMIIHRLMAEVAEIREHFNPEASKHARP